MNNRVIYDNQTIVPLTFLAFKYCAARLAHDFYIMHQLSSTDERLKSLDAIDQHYRILPDNITQQIYRQGLLLFRSIDCDSIDQINDRWYGYIILSRIYPFFAVAEFNGIVLKHYDLYRPLNKKKLIDRYVACFKCFSIALEREEFSFIREAFKFCYRLNYDTKIALSSKIVDLFWQEHKHITHINHSKKTKKYLENYLENFALEKIYRAAQETSKLRFLALDTQDIKTAVQYMLAIDSNPLFDILSVQMKRLIIVQLYLHYIDMMIDQKINFSFASLNECLDGIKNFYKSDQKSEGQTLEIILKEYVINEEFL